MGKSDVKIVGGIQMKGVDFKWQKLKTPEIELL